MGRGSAWLGLDKPPPPVILPPGDGLNELFRAYKKALGLKDKDIAEQLNTTAGYLQVKRHKGTDHWTIADVREMCKVLNITDPTALGEAILKR